jgi:predicted AAA+ superfamily ATPase
MRGDFGKNPDLSRVRESVLHYRPRPFPPEICEKPVIGVLRGPRRVGKTVSLKLLVAQLIEERGWDGRAIA